MCTSVLTGWDPARRPPPHPMPPHLGSVWAHIRGRYWSVSWDRRHLLVTPCIYFMLLSLSHSAYLYRSNQRQHWHLWTSAISSLSPPHILVLLFLNHIIVVALWIHLHLGSGDSDVRRRRGASRSCDRGTRTASHWFPWYPSRKMHKKENLNESRLWAFDELQYSHGPKARWSSSA